MSSVENTSPLEDLLHILDVLRSLPFLFFDWLSTFVKFDILWDLFPKNSTSWLSLSPKDKLLRLLVGQRSGNISIASMIKWMTIEQKFYCKLEKVVNMQTSVQAPILAYKMSQVIMTYWEGFSKHKTITWNKCVTWTKEDN